MPNIMKFNPEGGKDQKEYYEQENVEPAVLHLVTLIVMSGESFLTLNSFSGRKIIK